jgi:septal ring factor EnvC (AmiA/AmiB activator)
MWEPDRKLYALLLCLAALLLVASLATVSPEEMYLVNQNELRILLEISETLKADSENLKAEARSWQQTSETLELELENSTIELTALQSELIWQKKRLSELQQSLENSAKLAEELAQSAKESATRVNDLEQSTTRLVKDLSKSNKERNLWRIAAMVAGVIAGVGWTMILWYP